MKRIIKLSTLFMLIMNIDSISAQVLTNGTPENQFNNNNAFFDASTNFDPTLTFDNSNGKGFVFPRTDLTQWSWLLDDINNGGGVLLPTGYDGMIVYNTGTGNTPTGANNPTISTAVTPGFYYFSNPTVDPNNFAPSITDGQWIRIGDGGLNIYTGDGQLSGSRTVDLNNNTLSFNNGSLGIGSTPHSSAKLDISSNTQGFLPPRMTTAQRNAISNPATGLMVYNMSTSCLEINKGSSTIPEWKCFSNLPGTIATIDSPGVVINGTLFQNTIASGVSAVLPYTGGNGGYYSGLVINSTGVLGLTAQILDSVFNIGSGELTFIISGLPQHFGNANFAISIGGINYNLQIPVQTIWRAGTTHCHTTNFQEIHDVTNSATGKIWMDRNLGANRVATSSTDAEAYGSLFQWGRFADGHQCVNRYPGDGVTTSTTTNTQSSTDIPGHSNFIANTPANFYNWRSPQNVNLWQGENGTNNPCPIGYRIPTEAEWQAERDSWAQSPINSTTTSVGGFASPLKLTMGGLRHNTGGSILHVGTKGMYWSSFSISSNQASRLMDMNTSTTTTFSSPRSNAAAVRCIKN